jgi:predicted permease
VIPTLLRKLSWLVRRRQRDADLRDELAFHLEAEAEECRASGLSEGAARRVAALDFGHLPLVVEDTRATWGWRVAEQAVQDLRYAARTLVRTPVFTGAAIVTLAVGIGLTTSIFSIVRGVLLRPLPFADPDRLVVVGTTLSSDRQMEDAVSAPNFMSLREAAPSTLAAMAGAIQSEVTLTGAGDAQRVSGANVSAGLFDLLGVAPAIGRSFAPDDNNPASQRVAILGHALWQQQFGGAREAIGRTVMLDGVPHTVIGVMPPGFGFPYERALWMPLRYGIGSLSSTAVEGRKNNRFVMMIGRLRAGASLAASRAELDTVGRGLRSRFPEANAGVSFSARPLHDALVGDVERPLWLLLGAASLVLLIAGANVAGLLFARATTRRAELAVRAALGAGRARLVRQLVTEALALGGAGGALSIALAAWAAPRIVFTQMPGLQRLGLAGAVRLDVTVFAFALVVTIVLAIVAGLTPARGAVADVIAGGLRVAGRGTSAAHGARLRHWLVAAQLALAVVLLHATGLLVHSFLRLSSVDPGFAVGDVTTFRIALTGNYDADASVRSFFRDLLDNLAAREGVASVGAISRLPIGRGGSFTSRFHLEHRPAEEPSIGVRVITPGYLTTMRVPVVKGRGINAEDRAGGAPVVVINEAAARRFFPGQEPIGARLIDFSYDPIERAARAFTIVGIVADTRSRGLGEPAQPEAFFAHAQVPLAQMSVVIRAPGASRATADIIRAEVAARDRALPVLELRTMEQVVFDSLERSRVFTALLGSVSAIALLLAAIGLFGLLSFAVARRTHEFGIRLALGASPRTLVATVVRDASALAATGIGLGLCGAFVVTRLLASDLYGLGASDPVSLVAVIVVLGVTTLGASVIPARRAARLDPLTAIRFE